jgi:hypothetical protein
MPLHGYYLAMLGPIALLDLAILVCHWKLMKENKKTIFATIIFFAGPWYFIVDILAVRVWHIWFYDIGKVLDIWLSGTVIEEFLWMILVAFLFASLTIIMGPKRKKGL